MSVLTPEKYSFTKLEAFRQCPYCYQLTYIDHLKGVNNAFASYGSEIHSIMERYAKGELELTELVPTFEWEFDEAVSEDFPAFMPNARENYYLQGIAFLGNFQGYDDYKILEVEKYFESPVDDWLFDGIIDLAYEYDGRLYIQDYKSKSKFRSKKELAEKARQMYLYALYVKEHYGKFPDILKFKLFRSDTEIEIPFREADFDEAVTWARDIVKDIRNSFDYLPIEDRNYCANLCDHRDVCEYRRFY